MQETKNFLVRMPKDMWVFLKKLAIEEESTMIDIIKGCVQKLKKEREKKLDGR